MIWEGLKIGFKRSLKYFRERRKWPDLCDKYCKRFNLEGSITVFNVVPLSAWPIVFTPVVLLPGLKALEASKSRVQDSIPLTVDGYKCKRKRDIFGRSPISSSSRCLTGGRATAPARIDWLGVAIPLAIYRVAVVIGHIYPVVRLLPSK